VDFNQHDTVLRHRGLEAALENSQVFLLPEVSHVDGMRVADLAEVNRGRNGDSPELIRPTAIRPPLSGFAQTWTGPD